MFKRIISGIACASLLITMTACGDSNDIYSNFDGTPNDPTNSAEGNIGEVKLEKGDTYAVITVKDYGDITVKLFPDVAPKGTQNFIDLANKGYYNGKTFFRIVEDFMAQAGKPLEGEEDVEDFGIETSYKMHHFYGALCYANAMSKNSSQFYIVNSKTPQKLEDFSISRIENNIKISEEAAETYGKGTDGYLYYMNQANYYRRMKDFIENMPEEAKQKYLEVGGTLSLDGNYTVFGQTVDGFDVIDAIAKVEVVKNPDMNDEESLPTEDVIIESIVIKQYE